jgi:hypothetical protein
VNKYLFYIINKYVNIIEIKNIENIFIDVLNMRIKNFFAIVFEILKNYA